MHLHRETLERSTTADTDILDLTADVEAVVHGTGVESGWVMVFAPGSTAGITTIEYESGCLEDLARAVEQLAVAMGGEIARRLGLVPAEALAALEPEGGKGGTRSAVTQRFGAAG